MITMKYSISLKTAYPADIQYKNLPNDLVDVSQDDHDRIANRAIGEDFVISSDGTVTIIPARPSLAYDWDGSEWILNKDKQTDLIAASIARAKADKIDEINSRAQDYINIATGASDTPAFEVQTWSMQSTEAKAWHADNNAHTPMLSIIANQRGIPVDVLRAKAYSKAIAYEQIVAVVAGQRQKYEQQLDAAETLADIQSIDVVYSAG